jgi:glycosyl transferase, family 25
MLTDFPVKNAGSNGAHAQVGQTAFRTAPKTKVQPKQGSVDIVVISLSTAVERREWVEEQFRGSNLKWSYFDAHRDVFHPDLRYDETDIKRHFGRTLGQQEIAVYSSHYAVLKEFVDNSASDFILVLEDDVIFDIDFPLDVFSKYCSARGIDYVRLYGKFYRHAALIGHFFDRSLIRFRTSPSGAQAYLMSKAGARRYIDYARAVQATPDITMDSFWHHKMPIYSILPYPAIERFSPTSIPIPEFKELSMREKVIWNVNRTINKIRKVAEDYILMSSDAKMRRSSPAFHQVLGNE